MKPIINLENVSKQYLIGLGRVGLRETISNRINRIVKQGETDSKNLQIFWALRDISLSIYKGQSFGLIGPNGAGKTTILKILARITHPTSGAVAIEGNVSALIELGAGFHPDLTGRENVELNGAILGMSREEITRSFDAIVEFSGLEKFIDTPVKRYSTGMYVRLGFSIAAHVDPDILVVDEVLAVGDAEFRQKCAKRIGELQNKGTTIVFVSHNLWLVKSICDRVVFLINGQVQHDGDSVTSIKAYENWIHASQLESLVAQQKKPDLGRTSYVEIDKVEIRSIDGVSKVDFNYNDPVELRVLYHVAEPVSKPNLVLRIMRADGITCCMIRTDDSDYSLKSIEGKGVITVNIDPLQLSGGAYSIEAKLMMGSIDGMPLAIRHSSWFRVVGPSLSHEELSGVFVPRVTLVRLDPT